MVDNNIIDHFESLHISRRRHNATSRLFDRSRFASVDFRMD